jgi:hypothetical protein
VWIPIAGALATVAVYGFWPGRPSWAYLIPAGVGLAGLLVAVARYWRVPWILFALGQCLFFAGDLYYYGLGAPFPHSLGNFLYLSAYVPWLGGLIVMVACSGKVRLPEALWFLVLPLEAFYFLGAVHASGQYDQLILWAFPVDDVLLFVAACWLAMAHGLRCRWALWLVGALMILLATDFVYRGIEATGTYQMGSLLDLGWISFYLMVPVAVTVEKRQSVASETDNPQV